MRYRKRRRRSGISQNTAQAIVVLIVLGISLYVALATAVGSFMAQNVVAPIINYLSHRSAFADDSAPQGGQLTPDPSGGQSTAAPMQSAQLDLGGFSAYALQMGAFGSKDNALALADEQKSQGAGGYIVEVDGVYKVLGAVYQTDVQAKQVKGQLQQTAGVDCSIFIIDAPALQVKVTAPQGQVDAVRAACTALQAGCTQLYEIVQGLDNKQLNQAQAQAQLSTLAADMTASATALSQLPDVGSAKAVLDTLSQNQTLLLEASAAPPTTDAAFSALVKYAQINLLYTTSQMLLQLQV